MPTSIDLPTLQGGYNLKELGVKGDGVVDDGPRITAALARIALLSPAYGLVYAPPGTYLVKTPFEIPSNLCLEGFGPGTVFKLADDAQVNVCYVRSVSNVRIRNVRFDGNRANNTGGLHAILIYDCQDVWLENVEAVSARADGIRLDTCSRVELRGCKCNDNGRHGIALSYSEHCQIVSPRCYDNSQVESAGTGDGINLDVFSAYNTISHAVCYETAGVGDRQGYGIREAAASGCYKNLILGGSYPGNRTGKVHLDSGDSMAFTVDLTQVAAGVTIQP